MGRLLGALKKHRVWVFALPSLLGIVVFYLFPFAASFYYSLIDNPVLKNLVGPKNYIDTFGSAAFRLALRNTVIFTVIVVPLNMIFSYLFAILLRRVKKGGTLLSLVFMLPIVVPSGSVVYFWKVIFTSRGLINGAFAVVAAVIMFLWKNIGFNMVLFWVGLSYIPGAYYEYAAMEGAGRFKRFSLVTLPCLAPTAFLVALMSFINSFKIFREIYLLFGNYPPMSVYMLQHYMNNQFLSANMQKLTSASYILTALVIAIALALFALRKNVSKNAN